MSQSRQDRIDSYRKAQSTAELRRKALRSQRIRGMLWTQEQLDLIEREGALLAAKFRVRGLAA